jgi:alpha-mannosidase
MEVNDGNLAVGIVPLDEPLASFGDINRGKWPGEFKPESGTIFSYVMNNYWHTNYRAAQGGQFTFRYVVTSSKQLDGGALNKLGLEEMRPVEVNYVVPQDKVGNPPRPLAAEGQSFLEAHANNIALITWKKAEEGNGSILRLQELAGRASELDLHLSRNNIRSAQLCSGVEDPLEQLAVTNGTVHISFQPFEVKTIRVQ